MLLGNRRFSKVFRSSVPFQPNTVQEIIRSINRELFRANRFTVLQETKFSRNSIWALQQVKMFLINSYNQNDYGNPKWYGQTAGRLTNFKYFRLWFRQVSTLRAIKLCTCIDALRHQLHCMWKLNLWSVLAVSQKLGRYPEHYPNAGSCSLQWRASTFPTLRSWKSLYRTLLILSRRASPSRFAKDEDR